MKWTWKVVVRVSKASEESGGISEASEGTAGTDVARPRRADDQRNSHA